MTEKTFEKYKAVIDTWLSNGENGVRAYMEHYPNAKYEAADKSFRRMLGKDKIKGYLKERRTEIKIKYNIRPPKSKQIKSANKLYIIECMGFYKIGVTSNLQNRLRAFQVGNPFEFKVRLLKNCEDCRCVERELHKTFESVRVRGEWFKLNEFDLDRAIQLVNHLV